MLNVTSCLKNRGFVCTALINTATSRNSFSDRCRTSHNTPILIKSLLLSLHRHRCLLRRLKQSLLPTHFHTSYLYNGVHSTPNHDEMTVLIHPSCSSLRICPSESYFKVIGFSTTFLDNKKWFLPRVAPSCKFTDSVN